MRNCTLWHCNKSSTIQDIFSNDFCSSKVIIQKCNKIVNYIMTAMYNIITVVEFSEEDDKETEARDEYNSSFIIFKLRMFSGITN